MSCKYTIPTIPQNLSKEETVVQIAQVLDHLNSITQDIFLRINKRIEINTDKLATITNRIDKVSTKIEDLKGFGAKKAIKIFASSKYPAANVLRDYESVFKDVPEIKLKRKTMNLTNYSTVYELLTKLQLFHVKVPEEDGEQVFKGLGDIPPDIKYIDEMLLFNTGRNLYKDFTITDSLTGQQNPAGFEFNNASELGAAPPSISQRSSLQKIEKAYFYTPATEEIPAINVPLDLPDLPDIADDLRYDIENSSDIEPTKSDSDSELPDIFSGLPSSTVLEFTPQPPAMPVAANPLTINSATRILEIERRRDDSMNKENKNFSSVRRDSVAETDSPATITEYQTNRELLIPPPPLDARASLMEAIRKIGGSQKANLKKTNQPEKSEETITSTVKPINSFPAGDLMADLHAKLMMRRKGISGSKNQENAVSADSTLARISSMIPPPIPKNDNSFDDDDNDDDEDEWND